MSDEKHKKKPWVFSGKGMTFPTHLLCGDSFINHLIRIPEFSPTSISWKVFQPFLALQMKIHGENKKTSGASETKYSSHRVIRKLREISIGKAILKEEERSFSESLQVHRTVQGGRGVGHSARTWPDGRDDL